jgi:hypothetical protein
VHAPRRRHEEWRRNQRELGISRKPPRETAPGPVLGARDQSRVDGPALHAPARAHEIAGRDDGTNRCGADVRGGSELPTAIGEVAWGTSYPIDGVAQRPCVHGTRHDLPSVRQDGEAEERHPAADECTAERPQEDAIIFGVLEETAFARDAMNDVEEPVAVCSVARHGTSLFGVAHSAGSKRGAVRP